MADWAGLPLDILIAILEKVRSMDDFVASGYVCKSWREAVLDNKQYLQPQTPWLMLMDREHHRRQLYGFSKDDIPARMSDRMCIGLNYGWVLTASPKGEMDLFHPLSESQIQLPNQELIDFRPPYVNILSAALSANLWESSCVLMIAHGLMGARLSYWRGGDRSWTTIRDEALKTRTLSNLMNTNSSYWNLIHYQDRFYALDYHGRVWVCSVSDRRDPGEITHVFSRARAIEHS